MLTPEYLSNIEFNEVVKLYNQLNIDITADIIRRVSENQDITSTTEQQLRILKQTNGTEVFNETLNKTAMLTADTKKSLKTLYEDVAKNDIHSYKELYQYRNKPFKLSETQYKIINQGLKDTNKTLKNLTNSIAFRSQQTYMKTVDRAYMQAVTGGVSYTTAIDNAVQELAEKGITLKDKAGRNVQLEVAVRRNVMNGIRETSNRMERDIEKYLGCDGYEVTAHSGARPEHAEAQGKQFAVNKEDAKKYGLELWSDVEDLWHEYNCRHSYFGIILGVSEPIYNKKELKEMKEATVKYQGKEIPLYNATQTQRQFENAIRKQKRTIQILEKVNQDTTVAELKLDKTTREYNSFLKETGLQKDYSRIKVASISTYIEKNDKIYPKLGNNNKNNFGGSGKGTFIEQIKSKEIKVKLKEYEEDIRNLKIEYAVLIDEKHNVYAYTGTQTNLSIKDKKLDKVILTHNHPEVGSFGKDDFELLKENPNIKQLRAVDSEYTYILEIIKPIDITYNEIYLKGSQIAFETGEEIQHCTMIALKEMGYIKYERR